MQLIKVTVFNRLMNWKKNIKFRFRIRHRKITPNPQNLKQKTRKKNYQLLHTSHASTLLHLFPDSISKKNKISRIFIQARSTSTCMMMKWEAKKKVYIMMWMFCFHAFIQIFFQPVICLSTHTFQSIACMIYAVQFFFFILSR